MSEDDNVIQLRTGWEAMLAESKVILNRLKADQPKSLTIAEALDRWADSMEPCDLRDIIRGEYKPKGGA
jgi:hypothetical protein